MLSGTSRKISSLDNWKFEGLREEPSSTTNQYNEIDDLKDKIYYHLDSFKINSTPNTDGSVNKLVTIFAGDINASPSKIGS